MMMEGPLITGEWLDGPMDLDAFYGKPRYRLCAMVLVLWLLCVEPRGPVKVRGRL